MSQAGEHSVEDERRKLHGFIFRKKFLGWVSHRFQVQVLLDSCAADAIKSMLNSNKYRLILKDTGSNRAVGILAEIAEELAFNKYIIKEHLEQIRELASPASSV